MATEMGLSPTTLRELAPILKGGAEVARSTDDIRPISLVNELETVMDLAWLEETGERLRAFAGEEQAGGVYDPMMVIITLLAAPSSGPAHLHSGRRLAAAI